MVFSLQYDGMKLSWKFSAPAHKHRTKAKPPRTESYKNPSDGNRWRTTGLELAVKIDNRSNRFRLMAFDEIKDAIPRNGTSHVAGHCKKMTDKTGIFRCRRRGVFVFLIVRAAGTMIGGTKNQRMKSVSEQERHDRQNDHEKEGPLVFDT